MRKTLEDFYYGNITPNEQQMVPGSEMKKAVDHQLRKTAHGAPRGSRARDSYKAHPVTA